MRADSERDARVRRAQCGGSRSGGEEEKIRRRNRELFANLYECVRNERDESQEEMVKERNRDLVVVREQEGVNKRLRGRKRGREGSQTEVCRYRM